MAGLFVSLALSIWLLFPERYVEVRDRETGERYFLEAADEGETLRLSWVHSIEHTPWVEVYRVSDGRLALEEARVKSFGAGVDQVAPETETRDGWVILRGTERTFPALNFIYSEDVGHELRVGDRKLTLEERVPHHAAVEVGVERRPRVLRWAGAS